MNDLSTGSAADGDGVDPPQPAPQIVRVEVRPGLHLEVADFVPRLADAARPVVMLLHGGGQNRHAWDSTARALVRAGHRVVSYDARGHGCSAWAPDGDYALQAFADDLMAVRARLGLMASGVVGVGASMGGQTLLRTHRAGHGRRWAGIVLVDISTRSEAAGVRRIIEFMSAHPDGFASLEDVALATGAYNPLRRQRSSLAGLHKVVRQDADGRWRWRWDPAFVDHMRHHLASEAAWRDFIDELSREMQADARRVTAPTLLVRGAESDVVSERGIDHDLALMPHARVSHVHRAGHMVAGDNNEVFGQAIAEFLASLPATGAA